MRVVALAEGEAKILAVRVAGVPSKGIAQGLPVRVGGLLATPRAMGDPFGDQLPGRAHRALRGPGEPERWCPLEG